MLLDKTIVNKREKTSYNMINILKIQQNLYLKIAHRTICQCEIKAMFG